MRYKEWRMFRCHKCDGYGQVMGGVRGIGGEWEPDIVDCPECRGNGWLCISPHGRLTRYPGGPFMGYASESEVRDSERLRWEEVGTLDAWEKEGK
jgi:hypothetical protein